MNEGQETSVFKRKLRPLTLGDITKLLKLAKEKDDNDWMLFSYFTMTGCPLSQIEKFLLFDHNSLSRSQILRRFKKYSELLGFRLTPHQLREYYLKHWMEHGVNPKALAVLLGHRLVPDMTMLG